MPTLLKISVHKNMTKFIDRNLYYRNNREIEDIVYLSNGGLQYEAEAGSFLFFVYYYSYSF